MGNYNTLAAVIGAHHELALFRRFATLNAQNILYLQAELVHLESELASLALENSCSKDESPASFQASLFYLKDSSDGENESQWRKVLETREKLKEYNSALLQYSKIQNFGKPDSADLNLLQEWLDRPEGGDFFLQGREAEIWENEEDLVALCSRHRERDILTQWMCDTVVPWYHRHWGRRHKQTSNSHQTWHGLWHYEDTTCVAITNVISTLLSSTLPSASILVLYFVSSPMARLAVITICTALYSLTLATVTKAGRVDVFAVTTAFVAVQVVFVGGNGFSCV